MNRVLRRGSIRRPLREGATVAKNRPRRHIKESFNDYQSLVLVDVPITKIKVDSIDEDGAEWSCRVSKGFVDFWQIEDDDYQINSDESIDMEQGPYIDFTDESSKEVLGGHISGYLSRDSFQWHLSYDDESFDEEKPFNEETITEYLFNYFAGSEMSRADGTALVNMWHNTKCYATVGCDRYWGQWADYHNGHIIMERNDGDYDGYDPRYSHKSWDDIHTLGVYIKEADINAPAIVECIEWVSDNYYGWKYNDWGEDYELNESVRRPSRKRLSEKVNPYANMDIQICVNTNNLNISPRYGRDFCKKTQIVKDTEKYLKQLSFRITMEQVTSKIESLGFSFVASYFQCNNTCTIVYIRQTDRKPHDEFDGADTLEVNITGYDIIIETPDDIEIS